MTWQITNAVREHTPSFVAFAGPSGSGKTRSALELATGLAGEGI
jgi:DNA polymerase III delta prime subunit